VLSSFISKLPTRPNKRPRTSKKTTGGTQTKKTYTKKNKKKEGEVIEIDRKNNRAKVKGANIIKKHIKTTKEKKGGIISKENFVHLSNLSILENKKNNKKLTETLKKTSIFLLRPSNQKFIFVFSVKKKILINLI
jgi:large subunit ribosomal protein L24